MKKSETATTAGAKAGAKASTTNKNLTYEKAYAELEKIAREIEDEEVSVDVLAEHGAQSQGYPRGRPDNRDQQRCPALSM